MSTAGKRTTIYLDPALQRAFKLKRVETSRSVSALINDAVREAVLEDAEAFEARVHEDLISYDDMIKKLKEDGHL